MTKTVNVDIRCIQTLQCDNCGCFIEKGKPVVTVQEEMLGINSMWLFCSLACMDELEGQQVE